MALIPDEVAMTALSIAGTHDSGALNEPFSGVAKCQDLPILDQLEAGVRFLDIRCRHDQDAFSIYHGSVDEAQSFAAVMETLRRFLAEHPTEAMLVSVKEEGSAGVNTRTFAETLRSYIDEDPGVWFASSGVPTLAAARGKLVLVRRFESEVAMGVDASAWPDDTTFEIPGSMMYVQDHYKVADNDSKWGEVLDTIEKANAARDGVLTLNFTSGYQLQYEILPDITAVSDDINGRIDQLLRTSLLGGSEVLVMDFVTRERAAAVVAANERFMIRNRGP
jgi:1-phosphatidylinositol phosphodiesterase